MQGVHEIFRCYIIILYPKYVCRYLGQLYNVDCSIYINIAISRGVKVNGTNGRHGMAYSIPLYGNLSKEKSELCSASCL